MSHLSWVFAHKTYAGRLKVAAVVTAQACLATVQGLTMSQWESKGDTCLWVHVMTYVNVGRVTLLGITQTRSMCYTLHKSQERPTRSGLLGR